MQLSQNFSTEEMARTDHREFSEANIAALEQSAVALSSIKTLCIEFLEPMRLHFGAPVIIHSGYRMPELNLAVRGSKGSQHMKGEAADFHVVGVSLQGVFDWIRLTSGFHYGQVILEGAPSWVHLSLGEPWRKLDRCREAMTAKWSSKANEMIYTRVS